LLLHPGQDVKRKLSAFFISVDAENGSIRGYNTLSNNSISLDLVLTAVQKKLPKSYSSILIKLIVGLAVDNRFKGQGIGGNLTGDALKRSCKIVETIGSFAVILIHWTRMLKNFVKNMDLSNSLTAEKCFYQ